jgi:hypothetical protein
MPDLYLHPDGDALLVDPQGKLTADPACCCGAHSGYNAIVIELVFQLTPEPNLPGIAGFTDASAGPFYEELYAFYNSGKNRRATAFGKPGGGLGGFVDQAQFETASPACSICEGLPLYGAVIKSLDDFIPVGARTIRVIITGSAALPATPIYMAAHVYTADLVRIGLGVFRATGRQTLLCAENPTFFQIAQFQIACEFHFTRP